MKIQLKLRPVSDISAPCVKLVFNTIEEANTAESEMVYENHIPILEYSEIIKLGDTIFLTFPYYDYRAIFLNHYTKIDFNDNWWLDIPNTLKKETKMEEKENKITLKQLLELIDPDFINADWFDNVETLQIVRPNDGWDIYDEIRISSPLLIPFYNNVVKSIQAIKENVIRIELDYHSPHDKEN
jgi:hypothetical protein